MAGQILQCWVSSQYEDVILMCEEKDKEERNETVDDQKKEKET
jgi:hypothetical protein